MNKLLKLYEIIGQKEVTQEQAAANRARGKSPRKPRPAIPAIIPINAATWYRGVKSGRFPQPVKLGDRAVAWKAADIYALVSASQEEVLCQQS